MNYRTSMANREGVMRVDSIERRLEGYALIDLPVAELAKRVVQELKWRLNRRTTDSGEALEFLSQFTWPATRHVLVAGRPGWSLLLDNTPNADVDRVPFMAGRLAVRAIRVVDSPERSSQREGRPPFVLTHESRIVQVSDRSFDIQKSVFMVVDPEAETEFHVQDSDPANVGLHQFVDETRRRKRERFTSEQLRALVAALGGDAFTPQDFAQAGAYHLFTDPTVKHAVSKGTPEERDNPAWHLYQAGVLWSDRSHRVVPNWYDSVIRYMEGAVAFDPGYEARARKYLQQAYRAREKREGRK